MYSILPQQCEELQSLSSRDVTVYLAPASRYGKYVSTIPDERLQRGETHDVIIVLDPYPGASFGHLVVVFFLDLMTSRSQCEVKNGLYLGRLKMTFWQGRFMIRYVADDPLSMTVYN